jgi:hypothetical protein
MIDFNNEVSIADGISLVGITWPAGFQIREWVVGGRQGIVRKSALSMSVCFFGGPEEMTERSCQKLNTEEGSALALNEEPR